MSDQERLWELAQGSASSTEGLVTAVSWSTSTADVNVNGVTVTMPWAGPAPWVGDRVRVIRAGAGKVVCFQIQGAAQGTAVTTVSTIVTVTGDDGVTYRYPHLGAAPASGARVRLDHAGRVVLSGSYSDGPAAPEPEVPPPPPVTGRSGWFTPTWSGSWRNGSYAGPYVESSYTRVCGFGYASSVGDTIPDSATVTKAELNLVVNWDRSGSSTPASFGVHGHDGQPAVLAAGDLTGEVQVGRGVTVVDVRGFADALKTGAVRGFGIRPNSSYWLQYDAAPNSGRLYMEWSG